MWDDLKKRNIKKAGLPPGSLVHVGERKVEHCRITVIDYNQTSLREEVVLSIDECFQFRDTPTTSWINIEGIHDVALMEQIGKHYGIHSLVLEDIMNTAQRPRAEEYDSYIFIVLKMFFRQPGKTPLVSEQVSLVLGKGFVLSFQEGAEGDVFNSVRERIRSGKGRIRGMGADYLAYALIDAVVDSYFAVLEETGEEIEHIEHLIATDPSDLALRRIYRVKRASLIFRRAVWPVRELLMNLERHELSLVTAPVRPFLRDVYGHAIEAIDHLESYREMVAGLLEIYLSSISNRMNKVMMVLTLVTTIFMPLSFIAGVYGMNFEYMPELKWPYGYPLIMGFMLAVALFMVRSFRRRRWM